MRLSFALLVSIVTLAVICDAATSSELKYSDIEHTTALPSSNIITTERFLRSEKNTGVDGNKDNEERDSTIGAAAYFIKRAFQALVRKREIAALVKRAGFDEMYKKGVQPNQLFDFLGLSEVTATAVKFGGKLEGITNPQFITFTNYKTFYDNLKKRRY